MCWLLCAWPEGLESAGFITQVVLTQEGNRVFPHHVFRPYPLPQSANAPLSAPEAEVALGLSNWRVHWNFKILTSNVYGAFIPWLPRPKTLATSSGLGGRINLSHFPMPKVMSSLSSIGPWTPPAFPCPLSSRPHSIPCISWTLTPLHYQPGHSITLTHTNLVPLLGCSVVGENTHTQTNVCVCFSD